MSIYLNNKLFYYLIDEYHYSEEYGSNQYDLLSKMKDIFDDNNLVDLLTNKLKIISPSDFKVSGTAGSAGTAGTLSTPGNVGTVNTQGTAGTIIKSGLYNIFFGVNRVPPSTPLSLIRSDKRELERRYTEISDMINKHDITFIPVSLKAGDSRHATSIIIENLDGIYRIYYHNSGYGVSHHKRTTDYTIKDDAIIVKTASKQLMQYFIYFLLMTETQEEFYGNVMGMLESQDIYAKENENVDMTSDLNTKLTYFETQQVGSCSYRSIMLAMYTYLVLIKNYSPNKYSELTTLLRVYYIEKFFASFLSTNIDFSNNDYLYLLTLYNYTKDLYSDYKPTYFTNNKDFMNIIDKIDKHISDIDTKLQKYNNSNNPLTCFNRLQTSSVNFSKSLHNTTGFVTTTTNTLINFDPTIGEYFTDPVYQNYPKIKKYVTFNMLQKIIKTNHIHDVLNNTSVDTIFSSSMVAVFHDINSIIDHMHKGNLMLNPNKKTLDGEFLILVSYINKYLKPICDNLKLPPIRHYPYLTNKLSELKISSYNRYKLLNDLLEHMIKTDGLYFDYVYLNHEELLNQMYSAISLSRNTINDKVDKKQPISVNDINDNITNIDGIYVPTVDLDEILNMFAVRIVSNLITYDLHNWINALFTKSYTVQTGQKDVEYTEYESYQDQIYDQRGQYLRVEWKTRPVTKTRQDPVFETRYDMKDEDKPLILEKIKLEFNSAIQNFVDSNIDNLRHNTDISYRGKTIDKYDKIGQIFVNYKDGSNLDICYNKYGVVTHRLELLNLVTFSQQKKGYNPKLSVSNFWNHPNQVGGDPMSTTLNNAANGLTKIYDKGSMVSNINTQLNDKIKIYLDKYFTNPALTNKRYLEVYETDPDNNKYNMLSRRSQGIPLTNVDRSKHDFKDHYNSINTRVYDLATLDFMNRYVKNMIYVNCVVDPYIKQRGYSKKINDFVTENIFASSIVSKDLYSNQYTLPFLFKEITHNIYGDIRELNNSFNLYPNYYMVPGYFPDNTKNNIGENFHHNNFKDNLFDIFNSENLVLTFKSLHKLYKENIPILKEDEKIYIILFYLFYKINMVGAETNDIIEKCLQLVKEIINKHKLQSVGFVDYLAKYYEFKIFKKTNDKQLMQELIGSDLAQFTPNEDVSRILEEAVYFDILNYCQINNKYLNEIIDWGLKSSKLEEYDKDIEIVKITKKYKIRNDIVGTKTGTGIVFNYNGHNIHINGPISSKKKNPYSYYSNQNEYIIYFDNQRVITCQEIFGLVPYMSDHFQIIDNNGTIVFEPLDKDKEFKYELKHVHSLSNFKIETEINKEKVYLIPNTTTTYDMFQNDFLMDHIDYSENMFLFKNEVGDKIYVYFPKLNIDMTLDKDGLYIDGKRVVNCDQIYRYLIGPNRNCIITKKESNMEFIHVTITDTDKNNTVFNNKSPDHEAREAWVNVEAKQVERKDDPQHYYKYTNIKNRVVRADMNNDKIFFKNLHDGFSALAAASQENNYLLSRLIFKYINKTLTITELEKYKNYIVGAFPFNKILLKTLKYYVDKKDDVTSIIILNRHIPKELQLSKSYFDTINPDSIKLFLSKQRIPLYGTKDYKTKTFINLTTGNTGNTPTKIDINDLVTNHDNIDTIIFNYLCRLCDDTVWTATPGMQATMYQNKVVTSDDVKKYIFANKAVSEPKNKSNVGFDMDFNIVDVGGFIKWDILKMDNLNSFLINDTHSFDGLKKDNLILKKDRTEFETKQIMMIMSEEVERDDEEDDDDDYDLESEQIGKYIHEFVSTTIKYEIESGKLEAFRSSAKTIILNLLNGCNTKLATYIDFINNIKKISTSFANFTDNTKVAEYVFFETLKMKYITNLYKLGYDENGNELSEKKYNVEDNINLLMREILQNPGYIRYDSHNGNNDAKISVNTLIIFFDYYFSDQNRRKNPLLGGTIIRKEQYNLIINIINEECHLNNENRFHQMIMGAGKSSYIAPLLSLLLISIGMYPIHVMPEYLIQQSIGNMNILQNFGIASMPKYVTRNDISDKIYMFDELKSANIANINLMMSDTSIKATLLNNVQLNNNMMFKSMIGRLENAFLIFDEVDDISDPYRCELNYPDSSSVREIELLDDRLEFMIDILQYFYMEKLHIFTTYSFEKRQKTTFGNIYYIDTKITTDVLKTLYNDRINAIRDVIKKFMKVNDNRFDNNDEFIRILLNKDDLIEFIKKFVWTELQTNCLEIVYNLFHKVVPYCLKSSNRKDFGLLNLKGVDKDTKPEDIKPTLIAIPFSAVENPNKISEFSSLDITLALTIISYFNNSQILREGDYNSLLNEYYNKYKIMSVDDWEKSVEYSKYHKVILAITGSTIIDQKTVEITTTKSYSDIVKINPDLLDLQRTDQQIVTQLDIFRDYILKIAHIHLKEHIFQLNATFSDIATSDFCMNRTGFSGTPYFISPTDKNEKKTLLKIPVTDMATEGSIYYSAIHNNLNVFLVKSTDDILDIIGNYNALIDVGAYFLGHTNLAMAEIIYNKLQPIKSNPVVVYLNDLDEQCVFDKVNKVDKVDNKSSDYWNDKYIFVFYDQKHITGIDVKIMPLNAKGLVTLKHSNSIRDYSQGAYRLRKINVTQSVDICIDETIGVEQHIIKDGKLVNNNRQKRFGVLKYLVKREDKKKIDKANLQALHNIRTIFRFTLNKYDVTNIMYNLDYDNLRQNLFMIQSAYNLPTKIDDVAISAVKKQITEVKTIIKYIKTMYGVNKTLQDKINKLYKKLDRLGADLPSDRQQVAVQTQVQQQVQVVQQVSQQQNQQEIENLMQMLRQLYDKFKTIDKSYPIIQLVNLSPANEIETSTSNTSTFIYYKYNKYVYLSKLFIHRYFATPPNVDKVKNHEFVYSVICQNSNKFVIVTQEELLQIKSFYDLLKQDEKNRLQINYNQYTQYKILGLACLIDYVTDKIINVKHDIFLMIDNLIDDFDQFKKFTYSYPAAISKFIDEHFWKVVVAREKKGSKLFGNGNLEKIIKKCEDMTKNKIIPSDLDQYIKYLLLERLSLQNYRNTYKITLESKDISYKNADNFRANFTQIIQNIQSICGPQRTDLKSLIKYPDYSKYTDAQLTIEYVRLYDEYVKTFITHLCSIYDGKPIVFNLSTSRKSLIEMNKQLLLLIEMNKQYKKYITDIPPIHPIHPIQEPKPILVPSQIITAPPLRKYNPKLIHTYTNLFLIDMSVDELHGKLYVLTPSEIRVIDLKTKTNTVLVANAYSVLCFKIDKSNPNIAYMSTHYNIMKFDVNNKKIIESKTIPNSNFAFDRLNLQYDNSGKLQHIYATSFIRPTTMTMLPRLDVPKQTTLVPRFDFPIFKSDPDLTNIEKLEMTRNTKPDFIKNTDKEDDFYLLEDKKSIIHILPNKSGEVVYTESRISSIGINNQLKLLFVAEQTEIKVFSIPAFKEVTTFRWNPYLVLIEANESNNEIYIFDLDQRSLEVWQI